MDMEINANPPSPVLEESSDSSCESGEVDEPYSPPPITPGEPHRDSDGELGDVSDQGNSSDVDNPNFLRKMCSGFTGKLREKNGRIELYKKVLLNAQLQMGKREALYRKKIRKLLLARERENLEKNLPYGLGSPAREEEAQGNGPVELPNDGNPLGTFPEEVWALMFGNVVKSTDIASCSKANPIFARILQGTKPQWLYDQIFPLIFNKLRRRDLYNCRLVCRRWNAELDHFLENHYAVKTGKEDNQWDDLLMKELYLFKDIPVNVPAINHNPILDEYHFGIPPKQEEAGEGGESASESESGSVQSSHDSITFRLRDNQRLREEMRQHPRNPFMGRAVHLQENPSTETNIPPDPWNTFMMDASRFLHDFGRHIWYLRVECALDTQDPLQFYKLTTKVMNLCPDLRSLSLVADLDWKVLGKCRLGRLIAETGLYPRRPHFEKLTILTVNPHVLPIQDRLVDSYYPQLKHLSVQLWNHIPYTHYKWPELRELEVNSGLTDQIIESLTVLKAPNLRKLSLVFDEHGRHFSSMMELTNNFPKLDWVRIRLETGYCRKFCKQELMNLPGKSTCTATLTTLELVSKSSEIIAYDFLLFFPFLQRLIIGHEGNTREDEDMFYGDTLASIRKSEIIQIAKYIRWPYIESTVGSQLYQSNVWTVLPYLKIFELFNAQSFPEKRRVFTRREYDEHLQRVAMAMKGGAE